MNNEVLVPNIILTNNPLFAQSFGDPTAKYTSFSKFKQDLVDSGQSDNPSFIILDSTNINIINFNIKAKAGDQATVTLEFISRGDEFELRLLSSLLNQYKTNSFFKDYPKTTFYLAFGVGDNLNYWSNFIAINFASAATFQEFEKPKTVQLNFAVGLGVHESLELILSKVLPEESEAFSNISLFAGTSGPFSRKDWDLSKYYVDAPVGGNKGLILNYMFGFSQLDFLYKKVLREYLQTVFFQKVNVFILSEDLPKLALSRSNMPKFKEFTKALETKTEWASDRSDYIDSGSLDATAVETDEAKIRARKEATEKDKYLTEGYKRIQETLDGFLGTETNVPDGSFNSDGERNNTGTIKFYTTTEESEDKDYQALKNSVQSKVKDLTLGLGRLCGETVTLVREIDASIITNFIKNASPQTVSKSKTSSAAEFLLTYLNDLESPTNPSTRSSDPRSDLGSKPTVASLFDPTKPVLLLGPKSLVRAILYGEQPEGNQLLNTPYPTNEYSSKLVKAWKDLNLYESQTGATSKNYLEALLGSEGNNNQNSDEKRKNLTKLPTFRYNVINSNVLSIKSEQTNILNALLYSGFNKIPEFYSQAAQIVQGTKAQKLNANKRVNSKLLDYLINATYPQTGIKIPFSQSLPKATEVNPKVYEILSQNRDKAETKVREAFEQLKASGWVEEYDDASDLFPEDSFNPSQDQIVPRTLASILSEAFSSDEELQKDYLISNISIGSVDDLADPVLLYSKLLDTIQQLSFNVEITTLPFFPITGPFWLDYPCVLFANRLKLIGEKTDVSVLDQYLTGGYKIIGYSHTITEGRAESSFSLVRIPSSQLNKLANKGV